MIDQRMPAYPLLLIDPFFSIWSSSDNLSDGTVFWTGAKKTVKGYVRVGGTTYRFLGQGGGTPLRQTDVRVSAFETIYEFSGQDFTLTVNFVSPRIPSDTNLLSMPTCIVDYDVQFKGKAKEVEFFFAIGEDCCYNTKAGVRGCAVKCEGYEAAFVGRKRQLVLSNSQDSFAADWGYVYVGAECAYYVSETALRLLETNGELEYKDVLGEEKYIVGKGVGKSGSVVVGFDDICAINYFGQLLPGLYLSEHTIFDAISETISRQREILQLCHNFDKKMLADVDGDEKHYKILTASLRQSVAAHKLVKDKTGRLLFISKECHSNGCAATVDVSYPSSPLYLAYNPELVYGMLYPVFDFAKMPVWEFDFAPHDVGTYPLCLGQTYGLNNREDRYCADNYYIKDHINQETHLPFYTFPPGNEVYKFRDQMPVEECSNMLIMTAAASTLSQGKLSESDFALLGKWADYLVKNGLHPENQLCTDDFAGHLELNANLSIKAIVALGAYSLILSGKNENSAAEKYMSIARDYAASWKKSCLSDRKYSPLTMDGNGTYSLKYNLVFDKLLGLNLFEDIYENECSATLAHMNKYGAPLDERMTYTKSDWLMWMTVLTKSKESQAQIIDSLYNYLIETPSRVPFSDWYDTICGKQMNFCNRTVVGGMFILLLAKNKILNKK